jgi:hypothetical protein
MGRPSPGGVGDPRGAAPPSRRCDCDEVNIGPRGDGNLERAWRFRGGFLENLWGIRPRLQGRAPGPSALRLLHPIWTGHGSAPRDALSARPTSCEPMRAWCPLLPRAPALRGADMGASRCEGDAVLLLPPKAGRHAALNPQGELDRGTAPPVRYQHGARLHCWMQCDHLGHLMGPQGRSEHVPHHAGASLTQRPQVGDRNAATGRLASRLAQMIMECGGIRQRATGALDPKGARAAPASCIAWLMWSAMADRPQPPLQHAQRQLHAGLALR